MQKYFKPMDLEAKLERLERMNQAFSSFFSNIQLQGEWNHFKENMFKFNDERWMYTYLTTLSVGQLFKENNVKQYAFVGGIAVLGNLFEEGQTVPSAWRGSYDIDLVTGKSVLPILQKGFVEIGKKEEFLKGITRYGIRLDKMSFYDDVEYEPISHIIDCDLWEPKTTKSYFNQEITDEFWKPQCKTILIEDVPLVVASAPYS